MGLRASGVGFKVRGIGCRAWGLWVYGLGPLRAEGSGSRFKEATMVSSRSTHPREGDAKKLWHQDAKCSSYSLGVLGVRLTTFEVYGFRFGSFEGVLQARRV